MTRAIINEISRVGNELLGREHRHHHRHHRHRHKRHLALKVVIYDGRRRIVQIFPLKPNARNTMATSVSVGHMISYSFIYVDTSGNPMLTPVTPDSPATWTNAPSDPSVDTFAPSADGNTAVLTALAAGSDTVGLAVIVGGVSFSASDAVTISAAAQVLGGVQIVSAVS